jgi:hypothetical protein
LSLQIAKEQEFLPRRPEGREDELEHALVEIIGRSIQSLNFELFAPSRFQLFFFVTFVSLVVNTHFFV